LEAYIEENGPRMTNYEKRNYEKAYANFAKDGYMITMKFADAEVIDPNIGIFWLYAYSSAYDTGYTAFYFDHRYIYGMSFFLQSVYNVDEQTFAETGRNIENYVCERFGKGLSRFEYETKEMDIGGKTEEVYGYFSEMGSTVYFFIDDTHYACFETSLSEAELRELLKGISFEKVPLEITE
ncbi:MAG: hypothetical protein IJW21_04115, partial [Clostridia bacterium]|nr:hypothetical protein [Clostridia bacterium]